METKKTTSKGLSLGHPFIIALGVIVIAYFGYLFGQWVHLVTH